MHDIYTLRKIPIRIALAYRLGKEIKSKTEKKDINRPIAFLYFLVCASKMASVEAFSLGDTAFSRWS